MIHKGESYIFLRECIFPSHILENLQGQQWGKGNIFLSAVWASGVLSRHFPHIQREYTLNLNPNTLSSLQLWLFPGGREGESEERREGRREGEL